MCWDCDSEPHYKYKEFRQGAVDPEDFYEEVNYKPRQKRKGRVRTRPGCPENEGKNHVYTWTTEYDSWWDAEFFRKHGFYRYEYKVCCGCRKRASGRKSYRPTAEYERLLRKRHRETGFRWF